MRKCIQNYFDYAVDKKNYIGISALFFSFSEYITMSLFVVELFT